MEIQGVAHQQYICTLIDEYSWFTMLRSLTSKAEAPAALLDMIAAMETQTGRKAKNLKTNNGGEYRSAELLRHLQAKGISLKETVTCHSQNNTIAERTNRTIVTMARTALLHTNLSKYLWPEAIAHLHIEKTEPLTKLWMANLQWSSFFPRPISNSKDPSSGHLENLFGSISLIPLESSPLGVLKVISLGTLQAQEYIVSTPKRSR